MTAAAFPAPSNPLFDQLGPAERAELLRLATRVHYANGAVIVREGDTDRSLFVIQAGRARVMKRDGSGSEFLLNTMQAGEAFGEVRLVDSQPASATVIADGAVELVRIDLDRILGDPDQLALRSSLNAALARILAARLRQSSDVAVAAMRAELEQSRAREAAGRIVVALVAVVCSCLLGMAFLLDLPPAERPNQGIASAVSIILAGAMTYGLLRRSPHSWATHGITRERLGASLLGGILYTLPALAAITLVKWIWIRLTPSLAAEPLFHPSAMFEDGRFRLVPWLLGLLAYGVLSPVQEFFARSGLQSSLAILMPRTDGKTHWKVILVANLIFAAVHGYIGFRFALGVFLPSLLWGWLYDRQRSLAGAALSHVLVGAYVLFVLGMQAIVGGH